MLRMIDNSCRTIWVLVSSFISTICVLNGRKVMPRIQKKPKKINI